MITTTDQWKFPMRFRPGTSSWRVAEFESPDRPWLLAEFEHVEAVYKSFLLTSIDTCERRSRTATIRWRGGGFDAEQVEQTSACWFRMALSG